MTAEERAEAEATYAMLVLQGWEMRVEHYESFISVAVGRPPAGLCWVDALTLNEAIVKLFDQHERFGADLLEQAQIVLPYLAEMALVD